MRDELADGAGRTWRFDDPWRWRPFDGDLTAGPRWPLSLLTRDGTPDPDAAAQIAAVTSTGSPADDITRWRELAAAEPPHALPAG
ncbi:hypothetical protein ABH920_002923 [Catenulispora sp. EB89]|uniref:hypothetical protein n=1 Tax=Catenulispora sp. EB89 TaxID=3156257 RepID=UPI0035179549